MRWHVTEASMNLARCSEHLELAGVFQDGCRERAAVLQDHSISVRHHKL